MGVAMSITAIPILGRLMMELNITRTRIGAITISAAAVDDACGWILLATISSVVQAQFQVWVTLTMIAQTIGFFLFVLLVLRPLLKRFVQRALRQGAGDMGMNSLAVIYGILFLCALVTSMIGIFAIFGAFLLGTVLSDEPQFRDVMIRHLRNFLTVIFLPIFFTYTGLRTDLGTLHSPLQWTLFLAVLGGAVAGKLGGCGLAAWWSGFSSRESLCIGTMMNTRALMELIVINVGRDLGVLPDSVFCMLVLMALATTIMTTPMLLRFMRGTELEPFINVSGFLGPGRIPG
jgi:Kef-type K+ transport system membrane component KefB